MSQTFPEPAGDPTGRPASPAEPVELPKSPEEPAGFSPGVSTPSEMAAVSPRPAMALFRPMAAFAGSEWRQTSLDWMQKSVEITANWLYELGSWIFGGLIVVALMLLQDLISLGFGDRAVLVAGLALALALPFNLAGLGIIRYFSSLKKQVVNEARQVLIQKSNLDAETLNRLMRDSESFPPNKRHFMDTSVSLALYLSVFFTFIGLCSALWRISWVTTLFFLIASVLALLLILRVIRHS